MPTFAVGSRTRAPQQLFLLDTVKLRTSERSPVERGIAERSEHMPRKPLDGASVRGISSPAKKAKQLSSVQLRPLSVLAPS